MLKVLFIIIRSISFFFFEPKVEIILNISFTNIHLEKEKKKRKELFMQLSKDVQYS